MNALFLSYWPLHDGLTQATVLPRLQVLQEYSYIETILLVTIERQQINIFKPQLTLPDKVKHISLNSENYRISLLNKVNDFVLFPNLLQKLVYKYEINVVLAHGSPAGALAYMLWQKTHIPFYVSSFEPHADYMAEAQVWSRKGLKFLFQKHWEQQQKKYATGLMPVAAAYHKLLEQQGVQPARLKTVACTTDLNKFNFQTRQREAIRAKLGWQQTTIGIYVGKFGGLYYNSEAFALYKCCFALVPEFRLLVLSPQEKAGIVKQLQSHAIDVSKVQVLTVLHEEVPAYLSAADLAFATYKSGPSKRFLSPIKTGEYWASGLPVLLTEGVGDDSDIIKREGGGATFNLAEAGSVDKAILQVQEIIKQPGHRAQIRELAVKYRSPEQIKEAYEYFLGEKLHV